MNQQLLTVACVTTLFSKEIRGETTAIGITRSRYLSRDLIMSSSCQDRHELNTHVVVKSGFLMTALCYAYLCTS